jgi:hypothetical protein
MAKSGETQQKRQRENKLREKAQLKRERRQQRQAEKKRVQGPGVEGLHHQLVPAEIEPANGNESDLEAASVDTIIPQAAPPLRGDGLVFKPGRTTANAPNRRNHGFEAICR